MKVTEHYAFLRKSYNSSQNTTNSSGKTTIPHRTPQIPEEKLRSLTEHYKFLRKSYDSSQNTTEGPKPPKSHQTSSPTPKKMPSIDKCSRRCFNLFQTFWETSTQENLTPEASDRPETRLELLTIISSIRFFVHVIISSLIVICFQYFSS